MKVFVYVIDTVRFLHYQGCGLTVSSHDYGDEQSEENKWFKIATVEVDVSQSQIDEIREYAVKKLRKEKSDIEAKALVKIEQEILCLEGK